MGTKPTASATVSPSEWRVSDAAPTSQEYYIILLINQAIDKGDDVQHFVHLCTLIGLRTGKKAEDVMLVPMPELDVLVRRMWAPLIIWAKMRGTVIKGAHS